MENRFTNRCSFSVGYCTRCYAISAWRCFCWLLLLLLLLVLVLLLMIMILIWVRLLLLLLPMVVVVAVVLLLMLVLVSLVFLCFAFPYIFISFQFFFAYSTQNHFPSILALSVLFAHLQVLTVFLRFFFTFIFPYCQTVGSFFSSSTMRRCCVAQQTNFPALPIFDLDHIHFSSSFFFWFVPLPLAIQHLQFKIAHFIQETVLNPFGCGGIENFLDFNGLFVLFRRLLLFPFLGIFPGEL